jgi:hypothetical protein
VAACVVRVADVSAPCVVCDCCAGRSSRSARGLCQLGSLSARCLCCVVHVTAGTFCLSSDVALSPAAFQQWLKEVCEGSRPACVVLACPNTVAVGEAVVGVVAPWVIAFGGCRPADVDHFVRCGRGLRVRGPWGRMSCKCDLVSFG